MSNCTTCGGFLRDPFDLSSSTSSSCQCNTGGLVTEGSALPTDTCCVSSVNGKVGAVTLTTANIPASGGYNYYANSLVANYLSATSPILFNSTTGVISHANSGVTAATYGSSSSVPVITVNATGHITSVTTASISSVTIGADLTAIEALTGTGYLVRTGTNTWALKSITGTAGQIAITYPDGVAGTTLIGLATTGVSAGTYGGALHYPIITVDAYGRITSATTQSVSTPSTVPPHTHTLGNLSNVDNAVDTGATVGETIVWDGSQFILGPLQVSYIDSTLTLYGGWKFASNGLGSDTNQINIVRRLEDVNGLSVVTINAVLYFSYSTLSSTFITFGASRYLQETQIATVPAGFRPTQVVTAPLSAVFNARNYWDTGHTTQFSATASYQIVNNLNVTISPAGVVSITCFVGADWQFPTLGAQQFVVPIVITYPVGLAV